METKQKMEQIIYRNRLFEVADDYINRDLNGDESKLQGTRFVHMIDCIRDELPRIDRDDTEALDKAFDAFVSLCLRYQRIPSLMLFGRLVRLQPCTMSRWRSGAVRAGSRHKEMVERWSATCEMILADAVLNDQKTSVNRIFLLKALYGYDDSPAGYVEQGSEQKTLLADQLPKLE